MMVAPSLNLKLLCSYGGKILPRYPDRKLRYHGGHTRVLSVHRSISFSELLVKLGELCGTCVSLRCQLPSEDLDALVSITSDEDLFNLIQEYDRAELVKIRAFLSPIPANGYHSNSRFSPVVSAHRITHHTPRQAGYPMLLKKSAGKVPCYADGKSTPAHLIHNANHWQ